MSKNTAANEKKIAILTSGGDAPGMNACVRAAVRYAMTKGYKVYGVKRGYVGMIEDDIFEMNYSSVSNCVHVGGTILRTGRSDDFKDPAVRKGAIENLVRRGIKNLIVVGGDGSFHGVQSICKESDINVIGIPATIDNDMGYTDYTIGFDTACNTVLDAMLKLRDTISSHDRIMIMEVMGRHCGDIALYTAVGGGAEYVILPEAPVDIDAIAADVKKGFDKGKTSTIIVLAEGRADVKDELKEKVKASTGRTVNHMALSYIQRGGNPSMSDRVLASRLAVRAVDLVDMGLRDRAVGVRGGSVIDMNIGEALAYPKTFDRALYNIAQCISK